MKLTLGINYGYGINYKIKMALLEERSTTGSRKQDYGIRGSRMLE